MQIKSNVDVLSKLSDRILEGSGVYREYTDEDMGNALIVFMEVFMARIYDHHKDKLTQEQLEDLAEEAGKSLRQTVNVFTGIDTHTFPLSTT